MSWPIALICGRYRRTVNLEKFCILSAVFSDRCIQLTVHLIRSNEVVASAKYFAHSFGIADQDMDIRGRYKCPDWSIAKVGTCFVFEIPSSARVSRPGWQEACDWKLIDDFPDV